MRHHPATAAPMALLVLTGCAGPVSSAPEAAPKESAYSCEALPTWGAVHAGSVAITIDGLPATDDPLEWVFVAEVAMALEEAEAAVCAQEALGDRTGRFNVWRREDFNPEEDSGSRAPAVDLTGQAGHAILLIAQGEADTIAWALYEISADSTESVADFDPHVLY